MTNDAFFTSASSGAPPESWPEGERSLRNWLRLKNSKKAAKNIRITNDAFFTSASSGAPPESWPEGEEA